MESPLLPTGAVARWRSQFTAVWSVSQAGRRVLGAILNCSESGAAAASVSLRLAPPRAALGVGKDGTRDDDKPTLASQGIGKNLAKEARKLGAPRRSSNRRCSRGFMEKGLALRAASAF